MRYTKYTNKELIGEYVSLLIRWLEDTTRYGDKGVRQRIEKLGNELVARDLLTLEDAHMFHMGRWR